MEELASQFKALSDKTRLRLLMLLIENNYCVRALAEELAISESAVSQHLKKLREAELVVGEKRGYWVHYSVRAEKLTELADKLVEAAEYGGEAKDDCCFED